MSLPRHIALVALSQPKLDSTLGSLFIAVAGASILYGITSIQTYIYYSLEKRDSKPFQFLIFFLWVLDTLHLAFVVNAGYFFFVSNFTNLGVLNEMPVSLAIISIVSALNDAVIRSVYTYRIWRFSGHNIFLVIMMSSFTLVSFLGGIGLGVLVVKFGTTKDLLRYTWMVDLTFIGGTLADTSIALSLTYLLRGFRTGFTRTDSIIRTLVLYAISTGALTSCVSVTSVITFATMPNSFVWFGILLVLPTLLLNALLTSLNSRQALRTNNASDFFSVHLPAIRPSVLGIHGGQDSLPRETRDLGGIMVDITTEQNAEDYGSAKHPVESV